MLSYLRTGELVTPGLSERMIEKLKIECDFFNLKGLRYKIEMAYPHPDDDEIVIDARGTKIKTNRRIIQNGQVNGLDDSIYVKMFCKFFNPESPNFLKVEDDGSYKIDLFPGYVRYLLAVCECEFDVSYARVQEELSKQYGTEIDKWEDEFYNIYF